MTNNNRFVGWGCIALTGSLQMIACQGANSAVNGHANERRTPMDPVAEEGTGRWTAANPDLHGFPDRASISGSSGSGVERASAAKGATQVSEKVVDARGIDTEKLEGPLFPSWEEYKGAAERTASDGTLFYVAEWDLAFASEQDLKAHYDRQMQAATGEKAAVHTLTGGAYDTWDRTEQSHISYCILSGTLGTNLGFDATDHPNVVTAMNDATKAWQQVANVRFTYVSSEDSDCYNASDQNRVTFAVVNAVNANCYAATYLPSQIRANKNDAHLDDDKLFVAWAALGTQVQGCKSVSLLTKTGVLTHELGHIIGLVHEMQFAPGWPPSPNDCLIETAGGHELTSYDQTSIMHYPWTQCLGNGTTVLEKLTPSDGAAARALYGMPVSWYVAAKII